MPGCYIPTFGNLATQMQRGLDAVTGVDEHQNMAGGASTNSWNRSWQAVGRAAQTTCRLGDNAIPGAKVQKRVHPWMGHASRCRHFACFFAHVQRPQQHRPAPASTAPARPPAGHRSTQQTKGRRQAAKDTLKGDGGSRIRPLLSISTTATTGPGPGPSPCQSSIQLGTPPPRRPRDTPRDTISRHQTQHLPGPRPTRHERTRPSSLPRRRPINPILRLPAGPRPPLRPPDHQPCVVRLLDCEPAAAHCVPPCRLPLCLISRPPASQPA